MLARLIAINESKKEENLFTFPEETVTINNHMIKRLEPLTTITRNIKVINRKQAGVSKTVKLYT